MEAIAAHPPRGIGARERQARGDAGHGMVEAGVETGDLHQMGGLACDLADRGEVVGLVERGERGKGIKFGNERLVDQARCPIAPAAMDHAVTDRDDGVILKVIVGPVVELAEQGLVSQPGAAVLGSLAPAFFEQDFARIAVDADARGSADPFELASGNMDRPLFLKMIEAKLDTR